MEILSQQIITMNSKKIKIMFRDYIIRQIKI